MLFSIPFSNRFLIDFRSLQTLKMLIFHCRGAHFHEIAVSRKLSKNHRILIQKASENQSKIDKKTYQKLYQEIHRFFIDFWSKMPPKMEPKGVQEHVFATLDFHPEPLKSSMDPFSRKNKPPDLNFLKKMYPEPDIFSKHASGNIKFHRKLNNHIRQSSHANKSCLTN